MTFPYIKRICSTAIGLSLLMLLASCDGQAANKTQAPPPPKVDVTVVQAKDVPLLDSATGRLAPYRSADVRARVSGILLERTYKEGSLVKKGQPLFQIDPAPLQAALNAAKADLAKAQAAYKNSRIHAKRAHKLAPKGYISQSSLDDADAAVRTAKASVAAAKAAVDNAKINLGYASVRSPIDGRAGKQQVTEGALVGQGQATLLTTVRQIDPMYVNFSLPVEDLEQLREAQQNGKASLADNGKIEVQITLPGGHPYKPIGTVDFSGISVTPSTGTIDLRAKISNPNRQLLPGMYVTLEANLGTLHNVFLIPQDAIQRDPSGAYALIVGQDNIVQRKNVQLRGIRGSNWLVTNGIESGQKVIVGGLVRAAIGKPVTPEEASSKPQKDSGATSEKQAPANAS